MFFYQVDVFNEITHGPCFVLGTCFIDAYVGINRDVIAEVELVEFGFVFGQERNVDFVVADWQCAVAGKYIVATFVQNL